MSDDRLPISRAMMCYVDRVKIGVADVPKPANFGASRAEMIQILIAKRIGEKEANRACDKALDAATNSLLARARQDKYYRERSARVAQIDSLRDQLAEVLRVLRSLPANSKDKLNAELSNAGTVRHFDTEVFEEFLSRLWTGLVDYLPLKEGYELKPIMTGSGCGYIGTRRATIMSLWELIPDDTRADVERDIRRRERKLGLSLLQIVSDNLKDFRPRTKGVRPAPHAPFMLEIHLIWNRLGLTGRLQNDGVTGANVKSAFQRFCNLAYTAVGGSGEISVRQIIKLRRKFKKPRGRLKKRGL